MIVWFSPLILRLQTIHYDDIHFFQVFFEYFATTVLEKEGWPQLKILIAQVPANYVLSLEARTLHFGVGFTQESFRYHIHLDGKRTHDKVGLVTSETSAINIVVPMHVFKLQAGQSPKDNPYHFGCALCFLMPNITNRFSETRPADKA